MQTDDEIDGFAVRVNANLVAWFVREDLAFAWGRDNYLAKWVMHPCRMPNRPHSWSAQMDKAETEPELLRARMIDPDD